MRLGLSTTSNFNEDDTARKLRRIGFLELVFKINALPDDESERIRQNTDLMREFLDRYGWTDEEVRAEMEKHLGKLDGHC
jgi:hypothetical protein